MLKFHSKCNTKCDAKDEIVDEVEISDALSNITNMTPVRRFFKDDIPDKTGFEPKPESKKRKKHLPRILENIDGTIFEEEEEEFDYDDDKEEGEEGEVEKEEDGSSSSDDDNSGSFFKLSRHLNKVFKKYNVESFYKAEPKPKHVIADDFFEDFEILKDESKSLNISESDEDIYRIDEWLSDLKNEPSTWISPIKQSYFDMDDEFNTDYKMDAKPDLSQSPSPTGSYFHMNEEIESRMEILRLEHSLSHLKLEEICSCCVYDLQDRINKCMYVAPMAPRQSYKSPYGNDSYSDITKQKNISLPLSNSVTLEQQSYYHKEDDMELTPTVSNSGSYFDMREEFDNCMEILRLEQSLSFIKLEESSSSSSNDSKL